MKMISSAVKKKWGKSYDRGEKRAFFVLPTGQTEAKLPAVLYDPSFKCTFYSCSAQFFCLVHLIMHLWVDKLDHLQSTNLTNSYKID